MAKHNVNNGRPNGVQNNNGRHNGERNNVRSTNGRNASMLDSNRGDNIVSHGNNEDEDITLDYRALTDLLPPQHAADGSGPGAVENCVQTGGTFMGLNEPTQHRQQPGSDMPQQSDGNMYQHAVDNMHRQAGNSMSMELAARADYSPLDVWLGNASNEDPFSHISVETPSSGQPTWIFYQPCTDD